jgi:hypothetical protein
MTFLKADFNHVMHYAATFTLPQLIPAIGIRHLPETSHSLSNSSAHCFFSITTTTLNQMTPEADLQYHLSPLTDSDEIRLLYLAPSSLNERIQCVTFHANLSSKPEYEALSYEWGSKEMKIITLNGEDYSVRTNLFDALLRLRLERAERILWIDAICINQDNVKERNHQVSRMASIYSQAQHVIVWLRELPDFECKLALGFLQLIQENNPMEVVDHFFRMDYNTRWGLQVWMGLRELALKRYWTRLWVVQEVLVASSIKVQCGLYCVPWINLKHFFEYLQLKPVRFNPFNGNREIELKAGDAMEAIMKSRMQAFVAGRPGNLTSNLSYLCWLHGKGECEKEVDKVFGLWALASDCCQQAVPVDYLLPCEQVLHKLLMHDIAAHGMPAKSASDVGAFKRQLFGRYGP